MTKQTSERFKKFFAIPSHGTYVNDVEELLLKVEELETEARQLKQALKQKEFSVMVLSVLTVLNLIAVLFLRAF